MVVMPLKKNSGKNLKASVEPWCKDRLDQGMSLAAVMVGVAILGILAVVMSDVFKNQFLAQKDLDLKVARMAVIRNINARIQDYCPNTNPDGTPFGPLAWVPAMCGARTYLRIPSRVAGQPDIISLFDPANELAAHKMGNILVRAFCVTNAAGQRELKMEAVSERDLANRVPNTEWKDISPRVPLACNIHR